MSPFVFSTMSISSTESEFGNTEPPYCFKSIDELRKNQTRYNQYNIFHMVERLRLLQAQGTVETIEPPDKSSNAYKMYKDFVVPPLPPAYEHLNLPPHWLIHMFVKKEKKRSHKKSTEELMPFQKLAQAIADAYKLIDQPTKAWLDEVSSKLLAYNKLMRDELAKHINEQENNEERQKSLASPVAVSYAQESARETRSNVGINDPPPFPNSVISTPISGAAIYERMRYLQNLHAADMSLEVALSSGRVPGTFQRSDMYSGNGRGLNDSYEVSPRGITSLFPGDHSLFSRMGLLPPLHQAQFLLRKEHSAKRQHEEEKGMENTSARDTKRFKTETHATNRPIPARAASKEFHYPAVIGGTVLSHNSLRMSALDLPFPCAMNSRATSGLASLGGPIRSYPPKVFESGAGSFYLESPIESYEHLMLGYQLGLQAASRGDASSGHSRYPRNDYFSRLQALRQRVLPSDTFDLANALPRSEFDLARSDMIRTLSAMDRRV